MAINDSASNSKNSSAKTVKGNKELHDYRIVADCDTHGVVAKITGHFTVLAANASEAKARAFHENPNIKRILEVRRMPPKFESYGQLVAWLERHSIEPEEARSAIQTEILNTKRPAAALYKARHETTR